METTQHTEATPEQLAAYAALRVGDTVLAGRGIVAVISGGNVFYSSTNPYSDFRAIWPLYPRDLA